MGVHPGCPGCSIVAASPVAVETNVGETISAAKVGVKQAINKQSKWYSLHAATLAFQPDYESYDALSPTTSHFQSASW